MVRNPHLSSQVLRMFTGLPFDTPCYQIVSLLLPLSHAILFPVILDALTGRGQANPGKEMKPRCIPILFQPLCNCPGVSSPCSTTPAGSRTLRWPRTSSSSGSSSPSKAYHSNPCPHSGQKQCHMFRFRRGVISGLASASDTVLLQQANRAIKKREKK